MESLFESLIFKAEESLKTSDYFAALNYLERASLIDEKHPGMLYLRAVCSYRNGQYKTAESDLLQIEANGDGNYYTYLLLADVYGFGLNQRENELVYLKKAWNLYADERIKKRME